MPQTDIGKTDITDMSSVVADLSIATSTIDGPTGSKETIYINSDWEKQLGFYNNKMAPEFKAVVNAKARWTVGKGVIAEEGSELYIGIMNGIGIDTFNTILENMITTMQIGGDAYAEQIKNDKEMLINLKPLDTGKVKVFANAKGQIIRYELISKVKGKNNKKFTPDQIFHLSRNRICDELHGQSLADTLSWIITAKSEALDDWKTVLHRNVWPLMILEVDTDDTTKLSHLKKEYADAINKKEVMLIPKGTTKPEKFGLAPNATLNPIPWLNYLDNKFYEAAGVPRVIVGGAGGITEAAVKIEYLAWEQTVEEDQLYIEEQAAMQLGLSFDLKFPASLMNDVLSSTAKDGPENIDPNETTASIEGNK